MVLRIQVLIEANFFGTWHGNFLGNFSVWLVVAVSSFQQGHFARLRFMQMGSCQCSLVRHYTNCFKIITHSEVWNPEVVISNPKNAFQCSANFVFVLWGTDSFPSHNEFQPA
jgi:hypothetical protein